MCAHDIDTKSIVHEIRQWVVRICGLLVGGERGREIITIMFMISLAY